MSKIFVVDDCSKCSYGTTKRYFTGNPVEMKFEWTCQKKEKRIACVEIFDKMLAIPDWCPLENSEGAPKLNNLIGIQVYLKDVKTLYHQATKLQENLSSLVEKLQQGYDNACKELETEIKSGKLKGGETSGCETTENTDYSSKI